MYKCLLYDGEYEWCGVTGKYCRKDAKMQKESADAKAECSKGNADNCKSCGFEAHEHERRVKKIRGDLMSKLKEGTPGYSMRAARIAAGLTIAELAELSGVAMNTIACAERCEHILNIATAALLADVLGLSIDDYVGHSPRKQGKNGV